MALVPVVVVLGILLATHSALAASPTQIVLSCSIPPPESHSPNGCSSSQSGPIISGGTAYIIGGFWVWCQTSSDNAYGMQCAGAMYMVENSVYETTSISGTANAGPTVSFTTSDGDMTCHLTVTGSSTLSGTCDGTPITFYNVIIVET